MRIFASPYENGDSSLTILKDKYKQKYREKKNESVDSF